MPSRIVPAELDRTDVVAFLASQFPDRSITGLRRLVGSGRVTVNGEPAQRARTVRVGDEVRFPALDDVVPRYVPSSTPPVVLAREGDVIAIDKPAGLSVLPERHAGTGVDSVVTRVLPLLGEGERVYPVHRLDKHTSGVLIVATSRRAARDLSRAFFDRDVEKTYRAVVRGVMLEDEGTIDMPLGRPRRQGQEARVDFQSGKAAVTRFRVLARYRGYTELALHPETGRTHQIRVHLKAIGYPLAVDPVYGSSRGVYLSEWKRGYRPKPGAPEKPLIDRLPLHAESVVFPLPDAAGGEPRTLEVVSPLPKDLRVLLAKLDRFGRLGAPRKPFPRR